MERRGPDGTHRRWRWLTRSVSVVKQHLAAAIGLLHDELLPELAEHGMRVVKRHRARRLPGWLLELERQFMAPDLPGLDPARRRSRLLCLILNLSLSLAVLLRDPQSGAEHLARVKVPKEMLPRFVPIGKSGLVVPLRTSSPTTCRRSSRAREIVACVPFRVDARRRLRRYPTRPTISCSAVEHELRRRRFGEVVRIEVGKGMDEEMRGELIEALETEERDLTSERHARPRRPLGAGA